MASTVTILTMCCSSVDTLFRYFDLTGVLKNKSATSILVP